MDDAEGFLAQAAAAEENAAAVKAEMEAIDKMQRELDDLYDLAWEAQNEVDRAWRKEEELWDQPSELAAQQIVTERAEAAANDAWDAA